MPYLCKMCLKELGDGHRDRTTNRVKACTKCNKVTCVAELTKDQYEELVTQRLKQ